MLRKLDPSKPTKEDRLEHGLTHLPFRSRCRHCVRGRGREEYCRSQESHEGGLPKLHVDYMFMGEEQEGKALAILVAREKHTKCTFSIVAPRKGTDHCVPRRLLAWMREIGLEHNDVVIRSDNEPALLTLIDAWSRQRVVEGGGNVI